MRSMNIFSKFPIYAQLVPLPVTAKNFSNALKTTLSTSLSSQQAAHIQLGGHAFSTGRRDARRECAKARKVLHGRCGRALLLSSCETLYQNPREQGKWRHISEPMF
uniref:Uncharacterized protein n=1 Tax=Parascaris univalens TaxID=6257 RepID=A0A915C5V7_PARUN